MDRLDPAAVDDRLRPIDGRYTWCPSCWSRCMPSCWCWCRLLPVGPADMPAVRCTPYVSAVPRMYPLYPVCIRCTPYVPAVPRMYPLYPVCTRFSPYPHLNPVYAPCRRFVGVPLHSSRLFRLPVVWYVFGCCLSVCVGV